MPLAALRPRSSGSVVILESTTYPGTTEELVAPIARGRVGSGSGVDFHLGYSPERIDPGNPVWDLRQHAEGRLRRQRASLDAVRASSTPSSTRTVPVSGTREAELTKLLENTFSHVNIALMNELAVYANALDIDVWSADRRRRHEAVRIPPFQPGPGVGGHCLPIDPSYLSWRVRSSLGQTFRFVELANDVNDHMPEYVVKRLSEALNRVRNPSGGAGSSCSGRLQAQHGRFP